MMNYFFVELGHRWCFNFGFRSIYLLWGRLINAFTVYCILEDGCVDSSMSIDGLCRL